MPHQAVDLRLGRMAASSGGNAPRVNLQRPLGNEIPSLTWTWADARPASGPPGPARDMLPFVRLGFLVNDARAASAVGRTA
jgi:hypothetical protein